MKTADQIKPNHGPVYAAALYPRLAEIFQRHGYALAVHGSLSRDFDLVAIPWTENVSSHDAVFADVVKAMAVDISPDSPSKKPHGRLAYTLIIGFGCCSADISFMPTKNEV